MSASPPEHPPLLDSVAAAFESRGWTFAPVEGREQEVLRAAFDAHHTRVDLHLQVFEPIRAISVVAEFPQRTDEPARRERLAELAMRCNESLTVGAFEMRWDAGCVLFRVTNIFGDQRADPDIIAGMVHATVAEMDRLAPPLAVVHRADGPELAGLDVAALLAREDWLPGEPVG